MDKQEFESLLKKYFQSTLSTDEERELIDILSNNPSQELLDYFDAYYQAHASSVSFSEDQKKHIWANIVKGQSEEKIPGRTRIFLKYAAILIFISLSILGGYKVWFSPNSIPFIEQTAQTTPIYLRSYTESLSVSLDRNGISKILTPGEWSQYGLVVDSNDILVMGNVGDAQKLEGLRLRIATQKGQVQQLKLADGSTVWMNSSSELRMPLVFSNHRREVQLVGEAYFEVASRAGTSFQVTTENNTTEVLGTHFNVAAHKGNVEETTLMEGSVRVFNKEGAVLLSPGEQAFGNEKLQKRKADLEKSMAWKHGDFYFDNLSIKELMKEIEEWYNIQFVEYKYEGLDRFSGIFKRTNSLENLLRNLEEVSSIRFNLKEGGVYVLKK